MKVAIFLVSVLLATGGYLVVRYRSAEVFRESAKGIVAWEASEGKRRFISRADVQGFPEAARYPIISSCFNEGGDHAGTKSCYKEAAAWMRELARQHEERRELGLVLLGAGASLGVSAYLVARRQRRLAELLG